jgi:predicted nucleotidyltransferase
MTFAIDIPKDKLRDFCQRWKITEFALFGSVTRPEEFRADSDVDVMVRWSNDARWTLFDVGDMENELREIFGRDVDLAQREGVEESNRFWRDSILSSAVPLDL